LVSLRLGCLHRARSRATRGAAGKRQQSDVAGALDGDTEPTLVTRANTGHATRKNFAALLHKLRKNVGALVVDQVHFLDAKLADFFLAEKLPLAAARSAWTAARTTRTRTFAASATATTGTALATSTTAAVTTVAAMPTLPATTWAAGPG
jgi:hypothetical protein